MDLFNMTHEMTKPVAFTKLFNLYNREIIQIKMKEGNEVQEHQSDKHVFIMVQKGSVSFKVNDEFHTLTDEQILYIEPNERHAIKAITDVSFIVIKS